MSISTRFSIHTSKRSIELWKFMYYTDMLEG